MQRDMQIECHVRGLQTLTQFYQAWCFLRAHVFVSDLQRFGAEGVSSRTRARTTKRSHYFYFPLRAETCINTSSGSCPQIYHDFFVRPPQQQQPKKNKRQQKLCTGYTQRTQNITQLGMCFSYLFNTNERGAQNKFTPYNSRFQLFQRHYLLSTK
jgi:hypothetical protein